MSTTENTSTIDEKKEEESGTSTSNPDFNKFMKNYLYIIIGPILFSIVFIGGLGLFTTKVAEANILPDNIDFFPYTDIDPVIQQIPVNINIMKPSLFPKEEEILSQKAIFNSKEYLDSFNNSLLHFLQKGSEDPSITLANIPLYLSYVYNNTTCRGFQTLNIIFSNLAYLPEWFIMILYGFLGILIWLALFVINCFWSWVYHLIYIPQLFRLSYIDKLTNKATWESSADISFFNFKNWGTLIFFCFFWWLMIIPIIISAVLSPIIITINNLISPFFATYKIKDQDKFINHANGQPINFNILKFLIQTLSYKSFFIFVMSTIALVTNGLTYLGSSSLIGILIAIGFAYFMGLYNNPMPEPGVDGFTFGLTEPNYQPPEIELTEISKDQAQTGGKKHKKKLTRHTKKYNIRLV